MKFKLENKEYIIISATKKVNIVDIEYGKIKHAFKEEEIRLMEDVLSSVSCETALSLLGFKDLEFTDYLFDYMRDNNTSVYTYKLEGKVVYGFLNQFTHEKSRPTETFTDLITVAKKELLGTNSSISL